MTSPPARSSSGSGTTATAARASSPATGGTADCSPLLHSSHSAPSRTSDSGAR